MVSTPNYQLLQPDPADFVNVTTQIDDNLTKIDQDMNRFDVQVFTATGTWTKPARCKRVDVEVQGGGGGSGGCAATGAGQTALTGGGGAGGYSRKSFLATALSSSETVTVGAGGNGGAAGNNNGTGGGDSSFATGKAYVVTGVGGNPSNGSAAGTGSGGVAGGSGGNATGGDINCPGGDGGSAVFAAAITLAAGNGGASILGTMSVGNVTGPANNGHSYGSGASGGFNAQSLGARAGANGTAGVVIVRNYY